VSMCQPCGNQVALQLLLHPPTPIQACFGNLPAIKFFCNCCFLSILPTHLCPPRPIQVSMCQSHNVVFAVTSRTLQLSIWKGCGNEVTLELLLLLSSSQCPRLRTNLKLLLQPCCSDVFFPLSPSTKHNPSLRCHLYRPSQIQMSMTQACGNHLALQKTLNSNHHPNVQVPY
jgi:hypothetical protein